MLRLIVFSRTFLSADIRSKEEEELYQTEKSHFDEVYDVDHDGYLSGEEIYTWLVPDDAGSAEAEAKHLMDKSDADKDGRLSIHEILSNYKHFIGSMQNDEMQNDNRIHDAEEL